MSKWPPPREEKKTDHVFPVDAGPFRPAEDDLERARSLAADACPRRYCFHWDSAAFHWERTPKEGCLFLVGEKLAWKYAGVPCCRSDPSSIVDQFDTNDLFARRDGMDLTKWVEYHLENQRLIQQVEKEHNEKNGR